MGEKQTDTKERGDNFDPALVTDKNKIDYHEDTEKLQFYPDNPESSYAKYRFMTKEATQYYDPCQESSKMSFKCLELNNYDKSKCKEYFDAYKECKKQWLASRRQNRNQWE